MSRAAPKARAGRPGRRPASQRKPGAAAPARDASRAAVHDEVAARAARVARLLRDAERYAAGGRLGQAWQLAGRAINEDPGSGPALLAAAGIALARGDRDTALALFERAAAAAPADTLAPRAKAALLVDLGRPEEAMALLAGLVEDHPSDPDVWFDLAGVGVATGRLDEAAEAIRAGLVIAPDAPHALRRQLVGLDMAAGRYEVAAAGYEAGLVRAGEDPALHAVIVSPFTGVREWCAARGAPYRPIEAPAPIEVRLPRYAGDGPEPGRIAVWQPPRYVAEIPNAMVTGASSLVVTPDADLLLDIATHPAAERFDLAHGPVRWARDGLALVDIPMPDGEVIETAINLLGTYSHNYYHWMLEILPRLANLEAACAPDDVAGLPVLIDSAPASTPQLREALAALLPDSPVIVVPKGATRHVRRLITPAQLAWLPPDLHNGLEMRAGDTIITPEAIDFLRRRFLPLYGAPADAPRRRIYVTKPDSLRLANGPELEVVLEAFGLERVLPERLSFAAQVRLFSQAEVIVMEGGGAVTGIAFAPPGARILVLVGDSLDHSFFSQIADHAGGTLTHLAGTRVGLHPKLYQCRYTVEPEVLRAAMDRHLR